MKITKRYAQKITRDYNSWEFLTELEKEVDIKSAEELVSESDKLFKNAKLLTLRDIAETQSAITPLKQSTGGK
jgi:hypothetical protein